MKKINLYVEIVLVIAIGLLYVLFFMEKSGKTAQNVPSSCEAVSATLPIAYVNMDTLLVKYEYSQVLNEQLMRKRENMQANYNQKARQFEEEAADFQRKYENNAFLSQQRMQSEQQRLIQKQQDLQALDEKLSQELAVELQNINARLRDSIYNYLDIFNQTHHYQMIFSNTANDNIMISEKVYDVTEEMVNGLNARFVNPDKKSKSKTR